MVRSPKLPTTNYQLQTSLSPIANMLVAIKNAEDAHHERVLIPFSQIKLSIAQILNKANFVGEVEKRKKKVKNSEFNFIDIWLSSGDPKIDRISGARLISKPSRRVYVKAIDIKKVKSGYGIAIISTPKGLMTGEEARKAKLGGEVICEIW